MREFGDADTIFADMDVLNPNKGYTPSELPERERELDELHSALRPATMGSTPLNVFVYGPTGQGKTEGIGIKTKQLKEYTDSQDIDLSIIRVKCKGLDKSYHVLTHLIRELRGRGEELVKGYQQKELFDIVEDELRELGGTVIIVLDEIDAIGDDDYVLYELSRLQLENVNLSVIGVTNDLQFRNNLDADVRSSLGEDEIEFPPYDSNQLRAILARRAAKALRDTEFSEPAAAEADTRPVVYRPEVEGRVLVSEVLDENVIPLAAAVAANDSGDARQALQLMFRASRLADDEGSPRVDEDHVRKARELIERRIVEKGITSLPMQAMIALMAVTHLTIHKDDERHATTDLYDYHKRLCENLGSDPLSERRFREKLNDLADFNILNRETTGGGFSKGMTNRYWLAVDTGTVLDNLPEGDSGLGEAAESLRQRA